MFRGVVAASRLGQVVVPRAISTKQFGEKNLLPFVRSSGVWSSRRQFSLQVEAADEACHLTEAAAQRLANLRTKSDVSRLNLRLTVKGGGCKGFEYVFETTEEDAAADDFVFETNGERVLIDEVSFDLVKGSKIDYTKDLIREAFEVVNNPNADGACGCGASFAAKMEF